MSDRAELRLTAEDHDRAFTEVSFLLDIFVSAIGEVVNKSGPALGIAAGRHMGRKLPVHLADPTMESVLGAVAKRLASGFAIESRCGGAGADVGIARCAIRDVCAARRIEAGGELCRMFHYYLAGIATELLGGRAVRVTEATVGGDRCTFRLEAR